MHCEGQVGGKKVSVTVITLLYCILGNFACIVFFVQLMKHVFAVFAREEMYSMKICVDSKRLILSNSFREGQLFVGRTLDDCGKVVPVDERYVDSRARLLSAVSGYFTYFRGAKVDFIRALNMSRGWKASLEYQFSLSPMQIEQKLHNSSFSVMRRINIFSIVRTLLLRLRGIKVKLKISQRSISVRYQAVSNVSSSLEYRFRSGSCVLQALEDGRLYLYTVFLVVQEMITQWLHFVSYTNILCNAKVCSLLKEGRIYFMSF